MSSKCSKVSCRRTAIYPYHGKKYCSSCYGEVVMKVYSAIVNDIQGETYDCQDHVIISGYTNIQYHAGHCIIIEGDKVQVSVDETVLHMDKYSILHFRSNYSYGLGISSGTRGLIYYYSGRLSFSTNDIEAYVCYDQFRKWDRGDGIRYDRHRSDNIEYDPQQSNDDTIDLNDDDDRVLSDVISSLKKRESVFITGSAGTGKSHMIGILRKRLKNCACTASTGSAAHNINGKTIYSFSDLGCPKIVEFLRKIGKKREKNERLYNKHVNYRSLRSILLKVPRPQKDVEQLDIYPNDFVCMLYRYILFRYPSYRMPQILTTILSVLRNNTAITDSRLTVMTEEDLKSILETNIDAEPISKNTDLDFSGMTVKNIIDRIYDDIDEYERCSKVYKINEVRYLIVDEVSMLSNYFVEMLDFQMRTLRGNLDQFMGGIITIFVGDLLQLPPVRKDTDSPSVNRISNGDIITTDTNRKSITIEDIGDLGFGDILRRRKCKHICTYIIKYSEWNSNVTPYTLHINHRQSEDTTFRDMLNDIRMSIMKPDYKLLLKSRVVNNVDDTDNTVLYGKNAACDKRNKLCLERIDSPLEHYTATYTVTYSIGSRANKRSISRKYLLTSTPRSINKDVTLRDELELKVGAKVMLLANLAVGSGLVNGAIGEVIELSIDGKIIVKFESITVAVPRIVQHLCTDRQYTSRDKDPNKRIKTSIYMKQYPLTLAYGITIHKSQGNTYDNITISMTGNDIWKNDYGKAYVALSRARTLEGVNILTDNSGIPFYKFKADNTIKKQYQVWDKEQQSWNKT